MRDRYIKMDRKIVITGTGRCGTSFLMHLLTYYGCNTGYTKEEADIQVRRIQGLNAGIEHGIDSERIKNARVIKNPEFIQLKEFRQLQQHYDIEHVIIPIRDLTATAKSREKMSNETHAQYGGFWLGAENVEQQKAANAIYFYGFLHYLVNNDIQYTLVSFEKMMSQPLYLWNTFPECLGITDQDKLIEEYYKLKDPEKIRF